MHVIHYIVSNSLNVSYLILNKGLVTILKFGFLFGAGAEIDYNMPSGGTFALEIFRRDASGSKIKFKTMRDAVNSRSRYAASWLPVDYKTKNISCYGKSVFEAIIKDTIEHNRNKIIENLNSFDTAATSIVRKIQDSSGKLVDDAFKNIIGTEVRNISMRQDISFIDVFQEGDKLFANNYFSALLQVYSLSDKVSGETRTELRKILIAILQLQIGALGENLSRRISDNLFSKKIDEVDIFDDLGELVQLNYRSTGVSGLEYLLDCKRTSPRTDEEVVLCFAQELLENIFASVLDYKSLIDSNWHYLYCPNAEWAKFCKISIFLLTVQEYIEEQCSAADRTGIGYYDELADALAAGKLDVTAIATTNYTGLISDIMQTDIIYLNGSTNLWYDPYVNKIGTRDELNRKEPHITVPLMFTQSGTKPMTSIGMSVQYVDMYQRFKESDYICCIGFGFNPDDEHINGVIRTLVDEGKKLIVIRPDKGKTAYDVQVEISDALKVSESDNIQVILVDRDRKKDGECWAEHISSLP